MQPNTITLTVDPLNDDNPESRVVTLHDRVGDRNLYKHVDSDDISRDYVEMFRTAPKASGENRGTRKSLLRATVDFEVPNRSGTGEIVSPCVWGLTAPVVVGMTDNQVLEMRAKMVAFIMTDEFLALITEGSI
jgi:hypothetical protein